MEHVRGLTLCTPAGSLIAPVLGWPTCLSRAPWVHGPGGLFCWLTGAIRSCTVWFLYLNRAGLGSRRGWCFVGGAQRWRTPSAAGSMWAADPAGPQSAVVTVGRLGQNRPPWLAPRGSFLALVMCPLIAYYLDYERRSEPASRTLTTEKRS